jgi:hypothetical protein
LRVRIEEYSPPALTLGPDGVPQVLWANVERRWIYAARFLGEEFSPAIEVRGPFEQLTGPVLASKRMPATRPGIPLAIMTKTRVYLDELVLPPRTVSDGRQIDFVQLDEAVRDAS